MLFDLPDFQTLYTALLTRDERYDGQAFVCVSSTGVFCRLTCPARKPKAENCIFHATIGECIQAGFRPCKRCHPLQAAALEDPTITALLRELDAKPGLRWSEGHLERMGYDLSTVRRSFKRHFGMTFLEMARQRRLREGFETLAMGGNVIAAQHQASFESASAFRAAFARLLGCAPAALRTGGLLRASWIPTPLGDMVVVSSQSHLHLLEFVDRKGLPVELKRLQASIKDGIGIGVMPPSEQAAAELADYFAARSDCFKTPLALTSGSAFTQEVWRILQSIPAGETRSYSDIARQIGRPSAVRAVARANGANQIALMIPCHRVIGADGSLTGYGGGLWRKQRLIEIERELKRVKQ
ncbi:trifunctional transcriptional activator/DNA repair protein Ada/methylated-DNA--[protein]-cysteine S-methyltransferase [Alcaligenes nematophilus]|uniref:Trifunctional transcriptional activator/DNA repair protein Ada/methylated-DNA--[protein]-cysteine S-methyltransferase n=1 Tax=Alcaligenes nematophilus TaxID=2994643 RepID=A0ABU3MMD0_9BURK|nr:MULTISPECIES: trifunctional transcriptional activator/DNA repair protein Ada/methylated-DNA--[protein]-cysteine S-methyltransferase [Alcaligenes]KVX06867.1 6-O-methylguanine DNA methyltransferase [Alcaligenes faecalis]MDT8463522.1 trifunctional transcriptional activator/DNA repair protein Ada/methylated-DNA--[protein]-cysteine S-methyltransferase [Alcaligenes nematophilus]MDT8470422.1 trifunctional transcriptional activator/DNA repair protein Ada/methylated-DNA--[protein]-cysteine S-methyltra